MSSKQADLKFYVLGGQSSTSGEPIDCPHCGALAGKDDAVSISAIAKIPIRRRTKNWGNPICRTFSSCAAVVVCLSIVWLGYSVCVGCMGGGGRTTTRQLRAGPSPQQV